MIRLNKKEAGALKRILQPEYLSNLSGEDKRILEILYQKLTGKAKIDLYIDGAADLHSKRAGIGGVFYKNGEELYSFSEYVGNKTNNEAEYGALIKGLKLAHDMNLITLNIFSDSELIVKQINGDYKVRNKRMKVLFEQAMSLLMELSSWSLRHIYREKNKVADKLSKQAMMNKPGSTKGKQA